MALYLSSINSGSNGNCYYIGSENDAVLIDAGISCRETERRLYQLGLEIGRVRGIFISHEHTDHTRGVEVLSRKHRIPVWITPETHRAGKLWLDPQLVCHFMADEPIHVGELTILPFHKEHDGVDPHSFTVNTPDGLVAGVFTDIGMACENMVNHMSKCHAAFLESNYDEKMLMEGRYPWPLKRRISGNKGHLSNNQALELFLHHRAPQLELLILSHLSAQNNNPEVVQALFAPHSNGTRIEIASRYQATGVFTINKSCLK